MSISPNLASYLTAAHNPSNYKSELLTDDMLLKVENEYQAVKKNLSVMQFYEKIFARLVKNIQML